MSYILEKFGTTLIPQARPTMDIGAGQAQSVLVGLPSGGAYDAIGSARSRGQAITVNHAGAIYEDTNAAVQSALDALKALIGTRDQLFRRMPNGTVQWITARLTSLTGQRTIEHVHHLDLSLSFASHEYYWHGTHHGAGWLLDAGFNLDEGKVFDEANADVTTPIPASGTVTVTNAGNYPVRNAIISIYAGTTPITNLTLILTGATSLRYAGTIGSGKTLVLDCGKFTALNDGVDDFANLTRESGHVIADWLCLEPGANLVAVTRTGGDANSSITFTFDDGWA